ncbi:MAG: GntR family transcriptional regulator [Trueperaceae bacterium]|nr:GntR family transcriptional regulator [Trueperaceae bacterium]
MYKFQRPKTISEEVYDYLRQELFAGRIEPGRWLREQEVAEALQVSRTPVREAIRRLAQEGLMDFSTNRGAQARPISLTEAEEVYAIRDRLEGMAAGLAAKNVSPQEVAGLREQLAFIAELADDDFVGQIRADNAFHLSIATLSGNELLADMIQRLNDRVTRAKVITRDVNVTTLARGQHDFIVNAIAQADEAAAEEAMRKHVQTNLQILRERLAARPVAGR